MRWILLVAVFVTVAAQADCDFEPSALNRYEHEILKAAENKTYKSMAQPLACILQMQTESEGVARYLSNSYLRPLLGGPHPPGVVKDPRYKIISEMLEKLALHTNDVVQRSFVTEFSRGDWRFYTLFCEKGDTQFCSVFLPDEGRVRDESPLLAAASMMRLRKAYQVLQGEQRDVAAQRLKNLYRDIPKSESLKRKFIEQIYSELFQDQLPLG